METVSDSQTIKSGTNIQTEEPQKKETPPKEESFIEKIRRLDSDELQTFFKNCNDDEVVAIIKELKDRANQIADKKGPYYDRFVKQRDQNRKPLVAPFVRSTPIHYTEAQLAFMGGSGPTHRLRPCMTFS